MYIPVRSADGGLACNFLMVSLICFSCWGFWSLGGLEDLYNLLRNSESPNLPAAKAITVILMFIPARSAGGGLTNWESRLPGGVSALPRIHNSNRPKT